MSIAKKANMFSTILKIGDVSDSGQHAVKLSITIRIMDLEKNKYIFIKLNKRIQHNTKKCLHCKHALSSIFDMRTTVSFYNLKILLRFTGADTWNDNIRLEFD